MGGRGTFAAGKNVDYTYKTVDYIEGVKVLQGLNGKHGLPEEAHSSTAYIKLKPDGTFHEMRIYDADHYLVKEIAYHPEPNLNHGNRKENVLHIHEYQQNNFKDRKPRLLKPEEISLYQKYLKGVDLS
jgi:hypothetical protein